MSCEITKVKEASAGEKAGIAAGMRLVSINGHTIADVLDYEFYSADKNPFLVLEDKEGFAFTMRVKKEEYEPLGLSFATYLIDQPKSCHNKCIFCFIDQLPPGMRKTLYFKDDDTRLSFLTGNYVTLTNTTDADLNRIIEQRISPINISVHTTNPDLRCKMLGNRFAGDILDKMKKLAAGRIVMNCQIVLCRDINDKEELARTLGDLLALYPAVNSLSVVPAGLTKYREGLYPLEPLTKEDAADVIGQIDAIGEKCTREKGSRVVYAADELYIKAGRSLPDVSYYEDFPQIENGVGLLASFMEEFYTALSRSEGELAGARGLVSVATGAAAAPYIASLVDELEKKCHNLHINVYKINNDFFGEEITVAGLLTGQDLISQLSGKILGDRLLIPASMLRSDRTAFLDDGTPEELSGKLKIPVFAVEADGAAFLAALTCAGDKT